MQTSSLAFKIKSLFLVVIFLGSSLTHYSSCSLHLYRSLRCSQGVNHSPEISYTFSRNYIVYNKDLQKFYSFTRNFVQLFKEWFAIPIFLHIIFVIIIWNSDFIVAHALVTRHVVHQLHDTDTDKSQLTW